MVFDDTLIGSGRRTFFIGNFRGLSNVVISVELSNVVTYEEHLAFQVLWFFAKYLVSEGI